ncbi:MAG: DUF885 domain-containing protein [Candidatus Limnocylindria bacterium]
MSSFSDLAAEFLTEYHTEHPVQASSLGLAAYDDQLDDLSADAFERRRLSDDAWLARFRSVDEANLTFDETIDRDLLVASLTERAIYDEWEDWRRNPDVYMNPGLDGVFILFLHRLRPEPELVASAIRRLRGIPAQLDAARANLRPDLVPALLLKRAVNQARAGANYTRELLPAQVEPANRPELEAAGAQAADALQAYATFLEAMEPNATGDWAFGEARYNAVLNDAELLGISARQLRERARGEIETLTADMRATARQIAGHDDWHALILELNRDRPADPEAMRVGYEDWTARARAFLREKGLVSFPPGEECSVEPSPPFQRPVLAVASYQDPPPFSDSMRGHFFVPFPPDEASEEEIAKRLESNCYPSIPSTSVHEAYPGHHWHLVMAKLNPSAARQVFGTSYFAEGWALYAERMMREAGFYSDPRHVLYQYEATLFRAARVVVDTSLHLGEMTHDEAVAFMLEHSSMTEPTAIAEVTRYCSWPTQASSYLTGCLEILRIRDQFLAARGASIADVDAMRDFHDGITGAGTLPIALAERAVMATA